jgi:hypothetical protein
MEVEYSSSAVKNRGEAGVNAKDRNPNQIRSWNSICIK